jgi:hypothetical protein
LLEASYRALGERDWRRVAEEFEQRHNVIWPDAGAEVQALVTDFCQRHALPTLPPFVDGPKDVWYTYREWRHEGGSPRLIFQQRWVTSGQRPRLIDLEVDADGYEIQRIDTWRPEPETIYPPCLLPLKFSPFSMTVDTFMEVVVGKLLADVRASLYLQASLLAEQMTNWRPINSEQRDADALRVRAERLYRYVAGGLSMAQLQRHPVGTREAARSTVSTQIYSLAEQLGVDLTSRRSRRQ